MSEVGIGSVRLPGIRNARVGEKIAREAVHRALGKLAAGSLTVHEGARSARFGLVRSRTPRFMCTTRRCIRRCCRAVPSPPAKPTCADTGHRLTRYR